MNDWFPKFPHWIEALLDRVPFRVIWWIDSHLNHLRPAGKNRRTCVSLRYCLSTDFRCFRDDYYWDKDARVWREKRTSADTPGSAFLRTRGKQPPTSGS